MTGYLNSARYFSPSTYVNGRQLFNDFGSPSLEIVPFMLLDLYGKNNAPSFFDEYKTILIVTTLSATAHWRNIYLKFNYFGKEILIINYDRLQKLFYYP